MDEAVRQRQLQLPVGVDRETREVVPLERTLAEPESVAGPDEMSTAERIEVVRSRWEAGEWLDIVYGTDGFVDLDRGTAELEAQSDMGRDLMRIAEMAAMRARQHVEEAGE